MKEEQKYLKDEKKEKSNFEEKKPAEVSVIYKYILPSFFLIIGIVCYIISLTGCEGTQAECLKDFDQTTIKTFVMIFTLGSFFLSLNYILFLYTKINTLVVIFQTIIFLYLCFVHDTGSNLKSHGSYNRIFLAIMLSLWFFVQNIFMLTYVIMKRRIILTIIFLGIIIGISSVLININLVNQCKNWEKGLGDSKFDNSSFDCKIKTPKKCWMNLMSGIFDISGVFREDCTQIRMDSKEQFRRWTKVPNAKILGYPRTEKMKFFPDSTLDEFQFRVLGNMIDMQSNSVSQAVKDRTEAIIDFTKDKPELSVRVVRDENIAKERINRYKKNENNLMAKNVIHFFIDSLSRDNFRRKLPRTRAFLEKYYNNDNADAQVFQFFKYHGVASWTLANMVPMFFGVDFTHRKEPPTHYNKYFKDAGYVTAQGHGYCGREIIEMEPGNIEKFNFENFDHEINTIFCDPNFSVPGHPFAILNGPFSMKRRCLYGKDTHTYIFDYGRSFWEKYPNEPKFFRLAFQDAHEGTGEVVQYMDDKITSYFEFLEAKGSLKDTAIVFHSDHGVNMPGFYTFVDAEDFQIEKSLPTFFLILPQELAQKHKKELKAKENMMVTPYDIHNTFLHLINAPRTAWDKVGGSLFETINPKKRDCDTFRVRDPFCLCLGERDNPEPENY
jgi:hypothetical protein